MKHTWNIVIVLISLFLLTQIVGLATINKYIKPKEINGTIVIKHEDTILGPQPEIEKKSYSFIPITVAVLIGTLLVLLLIKFNLGKFWKVWFFLSVWITLTVSFDVYITRWVAVVLALILAFGKVFKPNVFVHNFTEIFIYTGITIIIIPFLNLFSGFALLVIISIYDMFAVWKSKHMIKLAKFQTKKRLFAGLLINYPAKKTAKAKAIKKEGKTAILGGGDIAFPLIFSASVMEHLITIGKIAKNIAFMETTIISLCVSIALLILFIKGEKGKFYPAMPFLSLGCIAGYIIIFIINLL